MPQQSNVKPTRSFEEWKDDLRRIVAEKTGQQLNEITVSETQAEVSWKKGLTPEKTFEENFKSL